MNSEQNDYWEVIDDFLDGNLAASEQERFQQQLLQDEGLRADLALQQALRNGIAYANQATLRERLQVIHQKTVGTKPEARIMPLKRASTWQRWATVAAVALIGVLGVFFWSRSQFSPEQLYVQNYAPYALELTQRGENLNENLNPLLDAYQSGDFTNAQLLLSTALQEDPQNAMLQLAQAISHWENGDQQAAQQLLQNLFTHPLIGDQAYWYAALFALKNGNTSDAQQYLQKIKSDSGQLYSRAQAILLKIER